MKPSLSTSIGPVHLERPTMLASGILGISLDVFNRIYKSGAGAVVTKSISPYTIAVGVPAREIRERNKEIKYKVVYFPWFDTDVQR